jgi:hypothetical protein
MLADARLQHSTGCFDWPETTGPKFLPGNQSGAILQNLDPVLSHPVNHHAATLTDIPTHIVELDA